MNFSKLETDLGALVETMTPPTVKASGQSLMEYYTAKRDAVYARWSALHDKQQKVHERSAVVALGAAVGSLGMLVTSTAPVVLPAATLVAVGTATVVAARVLIHHVRIAAADAELDATRRLVHEGSDEDMVRAYVREAGGPLTQLYQRTKDMLLGHDRRATALTARIDSTGLSGDAHRHAVQRMLREAATPAFVEYVRRNATLPYAGAAHLMTRLRALPGLDLTPLKPGISAGAGMPALGRTLVGLAPTRGAPSLLADLGLTAERKAPTPVTHYGYIAASESDRNFLQSLGIDLGTYDDMQGAFPARVDAQALRQLNEYREEFHADLHALPDGRVDARTLLLDTPVGTADAATLSGYRAFLRYTVGTEVGGRRAGDVLSDVNREVHRRNAAQRQLEQPARTAGATALEM
ncbi:hypothetical protein [Cupriavidus sp. TMH.W2]|uniref:hypothetical protein n=1 Tax=Cupriavidus sp. TMH.W2 TaxID=3434465 RepID=UPI003D77CED7